MNALTKSKIINIYKHINLNDTFSISIKRIVSVRM